MRTPAIHTLEGLAHTAEGTRLVRGELKRAAQEQILDTPVGSGRLQSRNPAPLSLTKRTTEAKFWTSCRKELRNPRSEFVNSHSGVVPSAEKQG